LKVFRRGFVLENQEIFTSVVRVKGSSKFNLVSVKSSEPIDKSLWIELSKVLSRIYVGAPMYMGDIICKNILNSGIDIISTANITKD
jgi:CxxC motif-containing protein